MNTYFKLPNRILSNPKQLANYCAVEIAEIFKDSPTQREITIVERLLKNLNFGLLGSKFAYQIARVFQKNPKTEDVTLVEAVVSTFYVARLGENSLAKAA